MLDEYINNHVIINNFHLILLNFIVNKLTYFCLKLVLGILCRFVPKVKAAAIHPAADLCHRRSRIYFCHRQFLLHNSTGQANVLIYAVLL